MVGTENNKISPRNRNKKHVKNGATDLYLLGLWVCHGLIQSVFLLWPKYCNIYFET